MPVDRAHAPSLGCAYMPSLKPVLDWNDLPTGNAFVVRETYTVEFKGGADPKRLAEHAKDIAAFANAFGGTLLVGAKELADGVEYRGLPASVAKEVAEAYRLALRDRVRPKPRVEVTELVNPETAQVVVAVNVHAFADQPVGCAVDLIQDDLGARKSLHAEHVAWRFPQRIGNHTRWIQPEELAMLINGPARRTALLLDPEWSFRTGTFRSGSIHRW